MAQSAVIEVSAIEQKNDCAILNSGGTVRDVGHSELTDATLLQRGVFNVLVLAVVLSAIRTLTSLPRRLVSAITLSAVAFVGSFVADGYPSQALIADRPIGGSSNFRETPQLIGKGLIGVGGRRYSTNG